MGLMPTPTVASIVFVMPLMVNHLRLISVIVANVVLLCEQMNPGVSCVEREKAYDQQADPPPSRAWGGCRSALLTSCEHLSAVLIQKRSELNKRFRVECQPALQDNAKAFGRGLGDRHSVRIRRGELALLKQCAAKAGLASSFCLRIVNLF